MMICRVIGYYVYIITPHAMLLPPPDTPEPLSAAILYDMFSLRVRLLLQT